MEHAIQLRTIQLPDGRRIGLGITQLEDDAADPGSEKPLYCLVFEKPLPDDVSEEVAEQDLVDDWQHIIDRAVLNRCMQTSLLISREAMVGLMGLYCQFESDHLSDEAKAEMDRDWPEWHRLEIRASETMQAIIDTLAEAVASFKVNDTGELYPLTLNWLNTATALLEAVNTDLVDQTPATNLPPPIS